MTKNAYHPQIHGVEKTHRYILTAWTSVAVNAWSVQRRVPEDIKLTSHA